MAVYWLIGSVNLVNGATLVQLVRFLLHGGKANGRALIGAGVGIWVTQVLVFAVWYWEIDRGGPGARCSAGHGPPDFLFPQMGNPAAGPRHWWPRFADYLYVSPHQLHRLQPHRYHALDADRQAAQRRPVAG